MKMYSIMIDNRINAKNVVLEMSIEEYVTIARIIIKKNEFQRNRVNRSNTVYSLLKTDLQTGCIIPPIIIALNTASDEVADIEEKIDTNKLVFSDLLKYEDNLLILDGFQRTNIIIDIYNELDRKEDKSSLEDYKKRNLRIEMYIGLNRLGILYRMLTLNTGQTPMSLRHQIEMMYLDYCLDKIEGIILIRDVDDEKSIGENRYAFKDVIDGFNSYLDRDELPIERIDVLNNIKGMEKLAKENSNSDVFKEYITTYNNIVMRINNESSDEKGNRWEYIDNENISGNPFGRDIVKIFHKSQALTGFGAAIGKLIDLRLVKDFSDVSSRASNIIIGQDDAINLLLTNLERIRLRSKKIGNAQRMYFQYLFRELFNSDGDSYLNLSLSVANAYKKYQSQVE